MVAKTVFALCASALFVQAISAACLNNIAPNTCLNSAATLLNSGLDGRLGGCAGDVLNGNMGLGYYGNIAASSGGAFPTSSSSPIYPTGVSVLSENEIQGGLAVAGQLPFLSAVALEGQVPSAGSSVVEYGCGNGNVGITSEGISGVDAASALGFGSALGYNSGLLGNSGYFGTPFANYIAPGASCGCNRYLM